MPTWAWVVIAVAAVVVLGGLAWTAFRANQRRRLRQDFGPEYERAVADAPTRREAEAELEERRKRREELEIRPLSPTTRERYQREWEAAQAQFVDDPEAAIGEADRLIQEVMRERGYPVDDFEQRAADLSVDHPDVIQNYRAGHATSRKVVRGEAETEEVRQAMIHYRALFDELLEARQREEVYSGGAGSSPLRALYPRSLGSTRSP
jgi:hypothetical protein